jgi:hypothetical protein
MYITCYMSVRYKTPVCEVQGKQMWCLLFCDDNNLIHTVQQSESTEFESDRYSVYFGFDVNYHTLLITPLLS